MSSNKPLYKSNLNRRKSDELDLEQSSLKTPFSSLMDTVDPALSLKNSFQFLTWGPASSGSTAALCAFPYTSMHASFIISRNCDELWGGLHFDTLGYGIEPEFSFLISQIEK